jgi:hypothetical protein
MWKRSLRGWFNHGLSLLLKVMANVPQEKEANISVCAYGNRGLNKPQQVPKLYSYSHARLCLDNCKRYHGGPCNKRSSKVTGMLVMDCTTITIVKARSSHPWLALSYVWGPEEVEKSYQIPKTVEDAIAVTKQLGYRYLWVDQYCVNQKDAGHKQDQIRQMDKIYQGADLTIVAAAGASKHFGLPGVSTERTAMHKSFHFGDRTIFWSGEDPVEHVQQHTKWWTRAW